MSDKVEKKRLAILMVLGEDGGAHGSQEITDRRAAPGHPATG